MNRTYRPRPSITPVVIGMDMVEEARRLERDRMLFGLDNIIVKLQSLEVDTSSSMYSFERTAHNRVRDMALTELDRLRARIVETS